MDQLPRLGKRELICLLLFTCNYVVSAWRGFLCLWVLGMGYVILLWHSLSLPYNYFAQNIDCGYTLEPPQCRLIEAVLMSTHNLCFRANNKKIMYAPVIQKLNIYKWGGVQVGIKHTDMLS